VAIAALATAGVVAVVAQKLATDVVAAGYARSEAMGMGYLGPPQLILMAKS